MGKNLFYSNPGPYDEAQEFFGSTDDFAWYVTAHLWTSLATDGGTSVAASAAHGGLLALTTGATDNNEAAAY